MEITNFKNINEKIKSLISNFPKDVILTSTILKEKGFKQEDIKNCINLGWLKEIYDDTYIRFYEELTVDGALWTIQQDCPRIHIGGRVGLDKYYGICRYVRVEKETIFLNSNCKLPQWFLALFKDKVKIFETDFIPFNLGLKQYENKYGLKFNIPCQEMASLELLYLVPKYISSVEAFEIGEFFYSLRPKTLQKLLENCKDIKVKKLILEIANNFKYDWLEELNLNKIQLDNKITEIDKDGDLYANYGLILDKEIASI